MPFGDRFALAPEFAQERATIFPGQPRNFELKPTAAQLIKLRKDRPELADLKPVNFNWSN